MAVLLRMRTIRSMKNFGDRLREAAANAGYESDAAAARAAKVEVRAYGHYVKGRIPKDPETLARMCRVFGTTPNHLLGFEAPGYQQEAAAIAETLTPAHRVLWFQYGRAAADRPTPRKPKKRRAA